jgi:hypothetical protein
MHHHHHRGGQEIAQRRSVDSHLVPRTHQRRGTKQEPREYVNSERPGGRRHEMAGLLGQCRGLRNDRIDALHP